ncbi:RnfABCDGE type electron transport complex subunit G [Romboutsia ilealis]|uniref:RnfABCDGE type electron transport complex subunit G n=1 Tax=Romboutsia ilealis TaxID=1115758 RepID=UPI002ED42F5B
MKDILKLGVTLFVICAVAALVLGITNNITSPVIEERNIQASNKSRQIVLSDAEEFKQLEGINSDIVVEVYEGLKGGDVIGYTIKTSPKGYGGAVEVMVGISTDGKITGVDIGNHSETPGLGSKASEPAFKDQYLDKGVANSLLVVKGSVNNDNEIYAISGATITSNGVTSGVNAAMKIYNEKLSGNGDKIAQDENIDPKEKLFKSASFRELEGEAEGEVLRVYEAKNGDETIGYIFDTETDGYSEKTEVLVGITIDGQIKGVELGINTRKNQYLASTFDTGLKQQFENIKAQEFELVSEFPKKDSDIQVVSGATISSKSIVNAVNVAVNLFNKMEV